jgi:hypothetical protein
MKKINLIWQTREGDETNFEFDYTVKILFDRFDKEFHFDHGKYETVMNNSVIIYSNNSNSVSDEFLSYLNSFKEKSYNFYLLHFSNENLSHDTTYYSLANHVFRNYYDPNIKQNNVTFIPLGVKSGFLCEENEKNEINKEFNFTFIGQPKSDRFDLLNIIENDNRNFIHKTNSWNCSTSLSQEECKVIYKKTKFVPCPMGWVHPDSFRVMECLESGSIPVIKKYNNENFLLPTFGENPIPVLNSWGEINNLLEMNYFEIYDKVMGWYKNFKDGLKNKIYNIINNEENNNIIVYEENNDKKKIRIQLMCWWTDSLRLNNRLIKQFVNDDDLNYYEFVTENPDYTIVFGKTEWEKITTPKEKTFYISQEPLWSHNQPKDNIHNYCSKIYVSDKQDYPDREEYIESLLPMFYAGRGESDYREEWDWSKKLFKEDFQKNKVCSLIVSNNYGSHFYNLSNLQTNRIIYSERTNISRQICDDLQSIDCWGTNQESNNLNKHGEIWNKLAALKEFKFSVCFENTIQKNYISEKFWDAILTDTVPIYIGCSNINDYINKDSFINLTSDIDDYASIKNKLEFIINNSDLLYEKYLTKIKELKLQFSQESKFNLWEFIKKIIEK